MPYFGASSLAEGFFNGIKIMKTKRHTEKTFEIEIVRYVQVRSKDLPATQLVMKVMTCVIVFLILYIASSWTRVSEAGADL